MDDEVRAALERIEKRLDYIEDHILSMSKAGARLPFVPMGRADYEPTDPTHVPDEVAELAQAGKRKEAIIRYRELTGADVQQAIEVIDSLSP